MAYADLPDERADHIRAIRARHYQKYAERYREQSRAWRAAHPEAVLANNAKRERKTERKLVPMVTDDGAWVKVGDLARELDEPVHTLHWWESAFGVSRQVRRMKGGARVYPPDVAALFREVRRLLRVELYTTAGAKRQLELASARPAPPQSAAAATPPPTARARRTQRASG